MCKNLAGAILYDAFKGIYRGFNDPLTRALEDTSVYFLKEKEIEFRTDKLRDMLEAAITDPKVNKLKYGDFIDVDRLAVQFAIFGDLYLEDQSENLRTAKEIVDYFTERFMYRVLADPQKSSFALSSYMELARAERSQITDMIQILLDHISILPEHSLDMIMQKPSHYDIPIMQIRQEISDEAPLDDQLLDFTRPVLMHGPPNVGKTCWAIRRAWYWKQRQAGYSDVFLLSAKRDEPEKVVKLAKGLPPQTSILYVIDDIHFASEDLVNWASSMRQVIDSKAVGSVHILWVARDSSIADKLVKSGRVINEPFPIERTLELFTRRLQQLTLGQRIIAVFDTGLDPRIAREFEFTPDREIHGFDEFAEWLSKEIHKRFYSELSGIRCDLGSKGYEVYLMLLPFGSISYRVEEDFLREVGLSPTTSMGPFLRYGRADITGRDQRFRVFLAEHPFQIRRKLNALAHDRAPDRAIDAIRRIYPDCSTDPNIPEAAFTLYISTQRSAEKQVSLIQQLNDHSIWSGVPDALVQGLNFLLDSVDWEVDEQTRDFVEDLYLSLARYDYRGNEFEFRRTLERHREFWVKERRVAEASASAMSHSRRLDHILYEIGYIDYLLEHYSKASKLLSQSVDASITAIEQGMQAKPHTLQWCNGAMSLANIWVAAILQRAARARDILYNATCSGGLSGRAQEELEGLSMEGASIYERLVAANSAGAEESAFLYIEALRTVRPTWRPPDGGIAYSRTPKMGSYLRRHALNTWIRAVEMSCWPTLFGFCARRIPAKMPTRHVSPGTDLPQIGLSLYIVQQAALLYRWADGSNSDDLEAEVIKTLALMRAAGGYQHYFGDLLLLAWRCASSDETAGALAWYLENRVPDVGSNRLPKKALKYLANTAQRRLLRK